MIIQDVPFCTVDWDAIEPTIHPDVTGEAYWRTFEMVHMTLLFDTPSRRELTVGGADEFLDHNPLIPRLH